MKWERNLQYLKYKITHEVGSYARISDSEGNIIGLFEMAK